ncbi:MAG: manganese efflux pump, partial [Bacteroidia bacterium]|nr:manganese efflux pump [Bacteroidia bacterium]
ARDLNGFKNIIVASVATSIDALAVGISLSMSGDSLSDVLFKDLAVFIVTVTSVMVGMFCGHRIGRKFGSAAEFIGGCVLILIGLNILLNFI